MATIYPKFNRGLEANLPSTITDGYIYITTDSARLYLDNDGERKEITDIAESTSTEIEALTDPKYKFYYAVDTNAFYYYTGSGWQTIQSTSTDDLTISINELTSSTTDTKYYLVASDSTTSASSFVYSENIYFDSNGSLYAPSFNGYELGAACEFDVQTSTSSSEDYTDDYLLSEARAYALLPTINGSSTYSSYYAPISIPEDTQLTYLAYYKYDSSSSVADCFTWVPASSIRSYIGITYGECDTITDGIGYVTYDASSTLYIASGSIVIIKFSVDMPAGSAISFNSGSTYYSLYKHADTAIEDGDINSGDICGFVYYNGDLYKFFNCNDEYIAIE